MVAVVMRALFDLCRPEIEKTKPALCSSGEIALSALAGCSRTWRTSVRRGNPVSV